MKYVVKTIALALSNLYGFLVSVAAAFGIGYFIGDVKNLGENSRANRYQPYYSYNSNKK